MTVHAVTVVSNVTVSTTVYIYIYTICNSYITGTRALSARVITSLYPKGYQKA